MRLITNPESRLKLSRSLQLMHGALDILDELDAPGEIGSMLDLAASRLEKFLDHDDQAAPRVQELIFKVDCERKPSPWDIPSV